MIYNWYNLFVFKWFCIICNLIIAIRVKFYLHNV